MKKYILILTFLLLSLFGTLMTEFSLAIWVTKSYESTLYYTLIAFFGVAPSSFLAPFIGSFVDRWDKRKIIIISNLVAGIGSLILVFLYLSNTLAPWHVMIIAFINSLADGFMSLAFYVSTLALVSKKQLSKARGISQTSIALITLSAPIIAPFLLGIIDLSGVFLIEVIAFFVTVGALFFIKLSGTPEETEKITFKKDAKIVFEFIRSQKGLRSLWGYNFIIIFTIGLVSIMLVPLMLDFSDEKGLGFMMSLAGVGMLLGGIFMSLWKGFSKPVITGVNINLIISLLLILIVFKLNVYVLGFVIVLIMICNSVIKTIDSTFWLMIVPEHLQGRVIGYQLLLTGTAAPLAYLVSGLLIDFVITPIIELLPQKVSYYPGTNKTVAIVILFALAGIINFIVSLVIRRRSFVNKLDVLYQKKKTEEEVEVLNKENLDIEPKESQKEISTISKNL
ncbi:MFS transporter [Aquimarina sp. I32.4]|uniref:MFS transporter n=1 Tax=Aquimarina sp. I32.4 TaxID=2053903 RepID=UPI000CDF26C2|nr:MFS transporter [Aquimarina sp. I32.4]